MDPMDQNKNAPTNQTEPLCMADKESEPRKPEEAAGQDKGVSATEIALEGEKLELERRKFKHMKRLENDKIKVERYKAMLQAIAIGIPLFGAMLTLVATLISNIAQSKAQFEMKTAELIMKDNGPDQGLARAQMLRQMFPNWLEDVNINIDPAQYSDHTLYENIDVKLKLLEFLVNHPDHRDQILDEYLRLFPDDHWVERLSAKKGSGSGSDNGNGSGSGSGSG